jgi:tRNA(Ile)-lysidine synthase
MRPASALPNPDRTVLRGYPAADRYLVGVSGGRDSVTLLHWLIRAGYRNLVVCHLNHQLRGRASDADARFVKELVAKYQNMEEADHPPRRRRGKRSACPTIGSNHIDLAVGTADVKALAVRRKLSIETAARKARHEFFARIAKETKCHSIFLAHHADDLVETFLINLFRGAGTTGLAGIRESSSHRVGTVDLQVIRPLLRVWRTDINRYVRQHRLTFREDASNSDLGPLRNRIRRRVIPYLEKNLGREIRQNIWRTAMIVAEEENFFTELMPAEVNADSVELMLGPLRDMAVALQRRTLHKWLRAGDVADVGFDLVERVRGLLDPTTRIVRTNLPRDRHVRRRAGKLILE